MAITLDKGLVMITTVDFNIGYFLCMTQNFNPVVYSFCTIG